jgi:hypothetical protein
MPYVIYNIETTKLLRVKSGGVGCYKETFASLGAAKAAMTRALKKGNLTVFVDYAIAEANEFRTKIEKKEMVRSLMSGEMVEQSVNTPRCCDPSSELYWSM